MNEVIVTTEAALHRCFYKRCSKNNQQIYRRTPMSKGDFNKITNNFIEIRLRHGCSPVNLVHILRTPLPRNTYGEGYFCN